MSTSEEAPLSGKIALVTGGSEGFGRGTAIGLARLGAQVTIVCRSRERGEATVAEIQRRTGNGSAVLLQGDLSTVEGVRRVAEEFLARHDRLHILVNNVGTLFERRRVTADGFEATFALNHVAPFVLTDLLLPVLKKSAPARIVNVASDAHRLTTMDFDDLMNAKDYRTLRTYGRSKLANVLFTRELARRLEGTGITVNAVHPGNAPRPKLENRLVNALFKLMVPFFPEDEKAARGPIYVASAPELAAVTGKYFNKRREQPVAPAAQNDADARRLWQMTEDLLAGIARSPVQAARVS